MPHLIALLSQRILILMSVALLPATVFTYGYLFEQVPLFKNGTCSGVSGDTIFGLKWPFALANLVRPRLQSLSASDTF